MRQFLLVGTWFISLVVLVGLRLLTPALIFVTSSGLDRWQAIASSVWFYVGSCFIVAAIEQYRSAKSGTYQTR